MSITLRQLNYFCTVAECGSVTSAAEELLVSQSAVSGAISQLESELGVDLFIRHTRGLSLSSEGLEILSRVKDVIASVDDLRKVARSLGSEVSGVIKVGCYSTIAPNLIPPIMDSVSISYPTLKVTFETGSRQRLVNGLLRGDYDVIVVYDYAFEEDLSSVAEVVPLTKIQPYALLPAKHPLAEKECIALSSLIDDDFILFELEPAARYFLSLFERIGLRPKVSFRSGSNEVIRGMVARGLGYSLLTQPTSHSKSHEGYPFVQLPLADGFEALPVVAAVSRSKFPRAKVEAFLRILQKICNSNN